MFAAVCVALSQVGHDLTAARPAPLWAGWTALIALGGLGYGLADRRRPPWWILLAVQAAQIGLHVWFNCCTPGGPRHVTVHMQMRGGVTHATGGLAMAHGTGMSSCMLGVHVLAGALAAAWLYAGERALWRALGAVTGFLVDRTLRVPALLANTGLPVGPRSPQVVGRAKGEPAPAAAILRHVLLRRGPPWAEASPYPVG
jgi:hypothetical protein